VSAIATTSGHVGFFQNAAFTSSPTASPPERQTQTVPGRPWPASCSVARRTAASSRHSEHGSASVVCRCISARQAGASLRYDPRDRAALRVHEPLRDIARPWSNLIVETASSTPSSEVRGLLVVSCSPIRSASRRASDCLTTCLGRDSRAHRLRHLLHAGEHEHLVQPVAQCPAGLSETNQSNNFIPSITTFNFGPPVLGRTVVSFAGLIRARRHSTFKQWSASVEKSLAAQTILEVGYQGRADFTCSGRI